MKNVEECLKILSNPFRPNSLDYINMIFSDFIELHGDRLFGDDESMLTGIGLLDEIPVTIIGQMRGRNLQENMKYHYSMNYPEGYRKSLRILKQAEKFKRPIVCFVDTKGAFPGDFAEERGQSGAIAMNLKEMFDIKVPIISILIGFGGSGGALALCIADEIIILENATFSVISPDACANILWKDLRKCSEAAKMLKITSYDLKKFNVVDRILEEPKGGAHIEPQKMALKIKRMIKLSLEKQLKIHEDIRVLQRYNKFRSF